MNFTVHDAAREELLEAVGAYSNVSPSLGDAFTQHVEDAFSLIRQSPRMFAKLESTSISAEIRRFLLTPRFPYSIVFELRSDRVEVLAIAHGSREPDYWAGRRDV